MAPCLYHYLPIQLTKTSAFLLSSFSLQDGGAFSPEEFPDDPESAPPSPEQEGSGDVSPEPPEQQQQQQQQQQSPDDRRPLSPTSLLRQKRDKAKAALELEEKKEKERQLLEEKKEKERQLLKEKAAEKRVKIAPYVSQKFEVLVGV